MSGPTGAIPPDTKDWTWVLDEPCPDCGYAATDVERERLPDLLHENTRRWFGVTDRASCADRPSPQVWSPLEYACHVRDVHELFDQRLRMMLEQDDPAFPNWDQDATALEKGYAADDPATVGVDLVERAAEVAATYARVTGPQWRRTGRRSDGSVFTVESLGRYHLHDVVHHLWDVGA